MTSSREFLEADVVFKYNGEYWDCVKNRFGHHYLGMNREEKDNLISRLRDDYRGRGLRILHV